METQGHRADDTPRCTVRGSNSNRQEEAFVQVRAPYETRNAIHRPKGKQRGLTP